MPNVVLTDEVTGVPGRMEVYTEPMQVRVYGSHIYVGLDVHSTDVTLSGESIRFKVRVRWAGGSTQPRVEEVWPAGTGLIAEGTGPTPDPSANVFVYLQDFGAKEWVLQFDKFNSLPKTVVLRPTPGDALQQIAVTGYVAGVSNEVIGFITKDSGSTPIFPPSGNVCWLTVPAEV